jgi:hypothetical protein
MRLPTDNERILIAGHTGSGKTHEALHHLSQRSIDTRPWVIVDFKGDDLVSKVPITAPRTLDDPPPDDPGLYVVPANWADGMPGGRVESYLAAIIDHGGIGVFVDEGVRLGHHNKGLRNLLTTGRSKECPCIFLCQRPLFIDTFALSESEYLQFFLLPHPHDQDRAREYAPGLDFDRLRAAGEHHSMAYDVRRNALELVGPAPSFDAIYDRILTRLPRYQDAPSSPIARNPRRVRI